MPKIDVKLASGGLKATRASLVDPILIPDSSLALRGGGQIRSPHIGGLNIGAGQIDYSPMPVPKIQQDELTTAFLAGAGLSSVVVKSVFDYNQRQDKAEVDYQSLQLRSELDALFYGTEQEDGSFKGGYGTTEGLKASSSFAAYKDEVERRVMHRLERLSDSQKAMAISDFKAVSNNYEVKGAAHAAQQLNQAEGDIQDALFDTVLKQTVQDAVAGNQIDMASVRKALQYPDADEALRRSSQLVGSVISAVYNGPGGETAAMQLLGVFAAPENAGVVDPSTVRTMKDYIVGQQSAAEVRAREKSNYEYSLGVRQRADSERVARDGAARDLPSAITSGKGLQGVVDGVYSRLGEYEANEVVGQMLTDSIKGAWDAAPDPGKKADIKESLLAQVDSLPVNHQDEVRRTLALLEKEDNERIYSNRRLASDTASVEEKERSRGWDVAIDGLVQKENTDSMALREAEGLLALDLGENQRARIHRWMDGTESAFRFQQLQQISQNWDDIMLHPEKLYDYPEISNSDLLRFENEVRTDRAANAAGVRSSGHKEILQDFLMPVLPDGSIDYSAFPETQEINGMTITRPLMMKHYQRAQQKYDKALTDFLDPRKNLSPMEAHEKAMTMVLGDESIRPYMIGLPKAKPGMDSQGNATSDEFDAPRSYRDDHTTVLYEYPVPRLPEFEGESSIVVYAQNLGKKEEREGKELPLPPSLMVLQHGNRISAHLKALVQKETDTDRLILLQRALKNHVAQMTYVMELVPNSEAPYSQREGLEGGAPTDADTTRHKKDGGKSGVRFQSPDGTSPDAPETETPEGQAASDQMQRAFRAVNPGGTWGYDMMGGSGYFNRELGSPRHGNTNMSVTGSEVFGYPDWERGK